MDVRTQRSAPRRARLNHQTSEDIAQTIWREYYAKLLVFVSTGSLLDAAATWEDHEDAVQEIMIKVLSNLHRYDRRYSLNTWIYSIARNHCIDARRRRAARVKRLRPFPDAEPPSPAAGPEELLFAKEDERLAERYMRSLSGAERQISYLRFSEGMSYAEIARVLEIPAGTVKYRIHEIRRGLKDALEQGSSQR